MVYLFNTIEKRGACNYIHFFDMKNVIAVYELLCNEDKFFLLIPTLVESMRYYIHALTVSREIY